MWGRVTTFAIVLAMAAAATWALWPRPIPVETAVIGISDLQVAVEEDGISRIREVFRVSLPVTGRLTRVDLHAGDSVTEGQTLAQLRPVGPGLLDERSRRVAEAVAEAASAALDVAEASLQQATAANDFAQDQLERTLTLADRGVVSAQAAQKATLDARIAQQAVDAARAGLLVRQRELESAQAALLEGADSTLEQCCIEIKAPASGRVLSVLTESEQVVQAGTPLMDIGDPANLEIEVDVLSSDAVRITPGAQAVITDWGGEPLAAEVSRVAPVAHTKVSALGIEEQRTSVLLRLLDGPETRRGMGDGYRVKAGIIVWQGKDRVTVPLGALFRSASDWAVFVVRDGVARIQILQIGQRNSDQAEVVSGLAEGDIVILHPGDTVVDGRSVIPEA